MASHVTGQTVCLTDYGATCCRCYCNKLLVLWSSWSECASVLCRVRLPIVGSGRECRPCIRNKAAPPATARLARAAGGSGARGGGGTLPCHVVGWVDPGRRRGRHRGRARRLVRGDRP